MNTIKVFENEQFGKIRTMEMPDGQVGFVGKDVAEVLGYARTADAIRKHVDEDDKGVFEMATPGGVQPIIFINESGLYALILSSKLPKAREFKHWVTSVVLPQIRQTGGYIPVEQGESDAELMARALMIAQKTIAKKDILIEAQRPKVQFANAVISSDGDILIRDLAKLLTQNGIEIGGTRMFRWLRRNGYIFKKETRPYQKWVERGLFSTNIFLIETHHGTEERCTTKVTGKGQEYFINGFLNGRFSL